MGLVEEEQLVHPEIPAEIPGVEMESDYEREGMGPAQEEPAPSPASLAAAAMRNAGLEETTGVISKTTGVGRARRSVKNIAKPNTFEESDSDSDIDSDSEDENDMPGLVSPNDDDSSDDDSDDEDDEILVEDVTENHIEAEVPEESKEPVEFGRGKRVMLNMVFPVWR